MNRAVPRRDSRCAVDPECDESTWPGRPLRPRDVRSGLVPQSAPTARASRSCARSGVQRCLVPVPQRLHPQASPLPAVASACRGPRCSARARCAGSRPPVRLPAPSRRRADAPPRCRGTPAAPATRSGPPRPPAAARWRGDCDRGRPRACATGHRRTSPTAPRCRPCRRSRRRGTGCRGTGSRRSSATCGNTRERSVRASCP